MDERRTLSLNVFLNTLEEGCKNERRYCFILGAGASKTSGIPTGEELAKQWHGEILEQCSKEEIKELKKRLGVRSTKPSSRAYFDLYAMRFFPDYQNGSAFLERTLERAQPSLGYYPLAALLANTRNNLVITTNFDSLVEDALFIYTDKRPIVISHELLAQYINFNTSRPIIAKLHRGLFFDPLNRAEQVNGLSKQWKDILREAFKRYTPVVIGYAGGDHSLMDFLKETECLSGLYWCYRHDEPPEEIQKVVERHSGYFIPIEGFDEMMYLMGQRFGYTDPCEHIESAAEQRVRDYQEQVKAFQEKLRAAETPSETQSAILRAMDAKQREELQRLDRRIELDEEDGEAYWERGKLYYFANDYAQALEDFTKAKELGMEDSKLYWYKGFCYRRLGETELAIREYSRSLELKETSEVYRNRGLCFTTVKLYDKAVCRRGTRGFTGSGAALTGIWRSTKRPRPIMRRRWSWNRPMRSSIRPWEMCRKGLERCRRPCRATKRPSRSTLIMQEPITTGGLYTCPRWRQKRRWPITERRSNSREIGRFIM